MKANLKGKVALITGSSRGIGRAIAEEFAKNGINLALAGRDESELQKTAAQVERYGVQTVIIKTDLLSREAPAQIVSEAVKKFGKIDFLVNNAGIAVSASFDKTSMDDWDRLIAINSRAPFFITKEALPVLRKSERAVVINISSAVGRLGYPEQAAYSASKHALMGWTKALAKEVQKDGIRVHVIAPGGVATEMITRMRPDINTAELMQPSEIADIALFLVSFTGNATIDEINVRRFTSPPWQ